MLFDPWIYINIGTRIYVLLDWLELRKTGSMMPEPHERLYSFQLENVVAPRGQIEI